MRALLMVIAFIITGVLTAQPETTTTSSRRIAPKESTGGTGRTGSMLFPDKKEDITYKRPSTAPKMSMRKTTDLTDPGIRFKGQKFFKDSAGPGFRSDTFLGEIRTGKVKLEMICRDHQFQDGDRVRVWLDDKVIIEQIYLTNAYQGFTINLKQGFNKLEIEALNQGSSGPNTAQFKVMDEAGKVLSENIWNLNAGVKATLIVIKE
jgi:hypothetical protein